MHLILFVLHLTGLEFIKTTIKFVFKVSESRQTLALKSLIEAESYSTLASVLIYSVAKAAASQLNVRQNSVWPLIKFATFF